MSNSIKDKVEEIMKISVEVVDSDKSKEDKIKEGLINKNLFRHIYNTNGDQWELFENKIINSIYKSRELVDVILSEPKDKKDQGRLENFIIESIEKKIRKDYGFSLRGINHTFDNYDITSNNKSFVEYVKKYADSFDVHLGKGEGFILKGKYGTGKTHLINAMLNRFVDIKIQKNVDYSIKFGSFLRLLMEIKNNFSDEQGILNKFCSYDLLILDDFGKEYMTDWNKQILYMLINERYEKMLPMILTTNCGSKELADRMGPASVSRLLENNVFMDFNKMDDYRIRKQKKLQESSR